MIISAPTDHREAARRRLPPFLFHYADGGACTETTLRNNVADLSQIALRQRVLRNVEDISTQTELFASV
jgi:L-lactate dehydrogenase (cytochrome)